MKCPLVGVDNKNLMKKRTYCIFLNNLALKDSKVEITWVLKEEIHPSLPNLNTRACFFTEYTIFTK